MGRPAYKINDTDYRDAIIYLLEQHKYSGAYHKLTLCLTGEELQSWCDDNLDAEQFQKLKQVIWARRKRSKDAMKSKKPKQITISRRAWKSLRELANQDGMNYSEVLENYLGALNECPTVLRKRFLETGKLYFSDN